MLIFACVCVCACLRFGLHRYHMDPSGTFVQCDARAIGSASEGAQSSLQEVYHKVRTPAEALGLPTACLIQIPLQNCTNRDLHAKTQKDGLQEFLEEMFCTFQK